jgi:hypothetical protein
VQLDGVDEVAVVAERELAAVGALSQPLEPVVE